MVRPDLIGELLKLRTFVPGHEYDKDGDHGVTRCRHPDCSPDSERVLNRFAAAVTFCYPEDMTPNAKRVFESIIEAEHNPDQIKDKT